MSRRRNVPPKKYKNILLSFLIITLIALGIIYWRQQQEPIPEPDIIANQLDIGKIKENFSQYVELKDGEHLYQKVGEKYQAVNTLRGKTSIALDSNYPITDEYFKLEANDYYVKYNTIQKLEQLPPRVGEYKYYKNYIPYNESIILKENAKLYIDENNYYEVSGGKFPIIIKDTTTYGIEYNSQLAYVLKEDISEVIEEQNTTQNPATSISVLNYHYTISDQNINGEKDECKQSICITDTMFDSQIKYLKENHFYGVSMRDLELFIDGKIQLPLKSVSITIDDGWYVARSITILEKYQMLGTLFLIGSLARPEDYASPYLEVHSHSWNLHKIGDCPSNVGRGGILCLDDNTILEDLKKSRESLNNTTYFCYPFYDYNQRAIELLKQAGFTMAFAGERKNKKVKVGQDKFKIPRYVIVNKTTMDQFIRYVNE